jgi:hypothetical protein
LINVDESMVMACYVFGMIRGERVNFLFNIKMLGMDGEAPSVFIIVLMYLPIEAYHIQHESFSLSGLGLVFLGSDALPMTAQRIVLQFPRIVIPACCDLKR